MHPVLSSPNHILTLLSQCNSLSSLKQIHAKMIILSISHPYQLLSKLISLPTSSKSTTNQLFTHSSLIFSQISDPSTFPYNLLIRALATSWQNYQLALDYFTNLLRTGLFPDHYTFPFVFLACANLPALKFGQNSHSLITKLGFCKHDHTIHSLITMYSKCKKQSHAQKLFDEIPNKDLVSWNSIISGYVKMGLAREALKLFKKMRAEKWGPNEVTIISVLAACGEIQDLEMGKWIEGFVARAKWEIGSKIGSALIDMYAECGVLNESRRVFDSIKKKDLVLWNAMITGYAQNGKSDEAISLFNTMKELNINPNEITLVGVLSACASVGALDLGKELHNYIFSKGLFANIFVGTSLIDMHAKCGDINNALKVFEKMPDRNIATYNALISALALNGRGKDALNMFNEMIERNISPDEITFIGILSACVHNGLVKEGRDLFDKMKVDFHVSPKIEHNSLMVDLFARAGFLNEAWNFIEELKGEIDGAILGSLLNACQKCKNVELGEKVINKLLEVEPRNSWNYIASSRFYKGFKRLDESAGIRVLMRERGVRKTAGCSWIEVCGEMNEFYARDELHFRAGEIYEMIGLLVCEMRLEGYFPNSELL
ncbi:hypothetical protein LUZ60_013743 [Juncus effusus]|nr:hypothetical protein LUZ60_013743 [Juncus effusus]